MAKSTIELVFPFGGLNRSLSYQNQPPYTTPGALNVRAKETIEGRTRGGSRPGLTKAFPQLLGTGQPVRLLNSVREITPTGGSFLVDEFLSGDMVTDNTIWTAASWTNGTPKVQDGYAFADTTVLDAGVVLNPLSPNIDTTKSYTVMLSIKSMATGSPAQSASAKVFLRMNNSTPNLLQDGVLVFVEDSFGGGHNYAVGIWVYSAGALVESYGTSFAGSGGLADNSMLTVIVNEDSASPNKVKATWVGQGGLNLTLQQTLSTTEVGKRIGFGAKIASTDVQIHSFSLNYSQVGAAGSFNRNRIVAGANQAIYEEDNSGQLILQTPTFYSAPTKTLSSVERLGWLYVADPTFRYQCASGCRLTDATERFGSLMVYKPEAGTYTEVVATVGTTPLQCTLVAQFLDRIVLANQSSQLGGENAPHMVYFSRQGVPADWDYSADDVGGAWATVNSEQAGKLPGPCTALITFSDDYMVFGSNRAIYVMRGDPRVSGTFDTISHTLGVVDAHAWCRDASNRVIFLSHAGLCSIASGQLYAGGIGVEQLSRVRLPRELQNIDVINKSVMLCYDVEENGVHIFLTPNTAGTGAGHWYYDMENDAFWPVKLPVSMEPTSIVYYAADNPMQSGVLLGCRDGYVRKFDRMAETDDGTEIESFVDYGPIMLTNDPMGRGATRELVGVLDEASNDVTWAVRTGKTDQAAYNATSRPDCQGVWMAGRSLTARPRSGGKSALVRVSGNGRPWAIDSIKLSREPTGTERH